MNMKLKSEEDYFHVSSLMNAFEERDVLVHVYEPWDKIEKVILE